MQSYPNVSDVLQHCVMLLCWKYFNIHFCYKSTRSSTRGNGSITFIILVLPTYFLLLLIQPLFSRISFISDSFGLNFMQIVLQCCTVGMVHALGHCHCLLHLSC